MKIPKDIQRIKDLVEHEKITQASMAESSNLFVYETICPECGKQKLMRTHFASWTYFPVSCGVDLATRNQKAQELLNKYDIPVTIDQNMLSNFALQHNTCLCHLDQPVRLAFGDNAYVDKLSISENGQMAFVFEAQGTAYEGRTDSIEQHNAGDVLIYSRNPRNKFDKQCIEILDDKKSNLGNVPAQLSKYISPLIDAGKVKISGSISSIETRTQRGSKAQKAKLYCFISILPTNQKSPMKWLLDSRIKYLKDEKIRVEVMGHCELRYSNKKQVSLSDFAAVHYTVEIFLECSGMGDPMYAIKALKPGEPVQVKPTGSLTDGDFSFSITDQVGNRIGRFSMAFVSAIAPLVEFGGLTIENPIYIGKVYDSEVFHREVPRLSFAMVIPLSYSSSSKQASCEADRIQKILASIVGNPSDELKRLILYIKSHGLEWRYFLALNTDGILYVVDPDHAPGDDYIIREDFGFECSDDGGFFYLFKQVPDDDPVRILEQNGIMISKLETLADTLEEEFDDEDDEEDEDDEDVLGAEKTGLLSGKRFVVTGKLKTFASRAELKDCLMACGGVLTETLSPAVDYLITNTPDSGTAKNKKAIELGIKRITEVQFNEMIGRIT